MPVPLSMALGGACLLTSVIAAPTSAIADEDASRSDWEVAATPYLWMLSLNGDAVIRGNPVNVDVGFDTILDNFSGGGMLDVRVHKGSLGVFLNGVYGRTTATSNLLFGGNPVQANMDVRMSFVDFGVSYRLEPVQIGMAVAVLEPYLGGRYTNIDANLKLNGLSFKSQFEFVDPIVGFGTTWTIGEQWRAVTLADVGGFGTGSDFSWNVLATFAYDFNLRADNDASVHLGYRALGQDFSEGGGASRKAWDVVTHGPIIGLTVRF